MILGSTPRAATKKISWVCEQVSKVGWKLPRQCNSDHTLLKFEVVGQLLWHLSNVINPTRRFVV